MIGIATLHRNLDKKNIGYRELENLMRQNVDFTNEDQVLNFIKIYKSQLFENVLQENHIIKRKASIGGFFTIANVLRPYENVIIYYLAFSFYYISTTSTTD